MVLGSRLDPSGLPTATSWSSPDGITWKATALTSAGESSQITAAAQYKETTVAVGSTGEGANQQAAVWMSPAPGSPFAPESVPTSSGPSIISLVAIGQLGMFAAGTVQGRFAMWTSTNGRQWSELPGAERVIGNPPGARVEALLANGSTVYAAGSVQSGPHLQPAVWATGDGLDWHQVTSANPSFDGPGDRVIYSMTPLGTGMVAVGGIDRGSGWVPASWISPDGQTWSLPSVDFPAVPNQLPSLYLGGTWGSAARSVSAVTTFVGSTEVVAAGGGPVGQGAWISSDGLHWASLGLPAAAAASNSWRAEVAASTIDTTVIADAEPGQPYLLTEKRPAASSGATGTAPAGTRWSQPSANPNVFGPVRPEAVPVSLQAVAGRLQLTVHRVNRPQAIGPSTASTETLVSSNGLSWTAAPAATRTSPPTRPAVDALTGRLPTGWVAVASPAEQSPQAWTSRTGTTWTRGPGLQTPAPAQPSGSSASNPVQSTVNGLCVTKVSVPAGASTASVYVASAVGSSGSVSPPPGSDESSPATANPAITTRAAVAWESDTGAAWHYAAVNAGPPAGGTQSMSGCLAADGGLLGFGTATAASGEPEPGLWRSTDGTSWSRISAGGLSPRTPDPLVSVAVSGSHWLAAANPDPLADPQPAGAAGAPGLAATASSDAGVGPAPSFADGRTGLWLSANGGSSWQVIDTFAAPWLGTDGGAVDLVGFAESTIPVAVGVVDGQLAVWTGAPAA
jgi:hypothetical protein